MSKRTGAAGLDGAGLVDLMSRKRDSLPPGRPRRLMDVLVTHTRAELVDHDIDATMDTLVDDPHYDYFGTGGLLKPIDGYEAVKSYYLRSFEGGMDGHLIVVDRVMIDDEGFSMMGKFAMSASLLTARHPHLKEIVDPSRACLLRKQMATVIPFSDDEKMTGEIVFWDGPFTADDIEYLDT